MNSEDPLGIGFFITKKYLLVLAGIVMGFAGFMVLRTGLKSTAGGWPIVQVLMTGVVFVLFLMMFVKFVRKNCKRIMGFQSEQVGLFNFLSTKGYFTMVFMMTLGLLLRNISIIPTSWIETFYTGLGSALSVAGILFLVEYFKVSIRTKSKDENVVSD